MKTIGILTFHRSYNYGAFMQCFALSTRIARDFPDCNVEVIDYCTKRMYENYPSRFLPFVLGPRDNRNSIRQVIKQIGKCLLNPTLLKKKRRLYLGFDENISRISLSSFQIISNEYEPLFKKIDEKYDVLIVGSDAVWEYITYPFPNAYYPNYNFKRTKLLSYAASSDRMHINNLTLESRDYIRQTLERFDYIGIRDVATYNFLCNLSLRESLHHNCDPTTFLNLSEVPGDLNRVKKMLVDAGIDLSRPIIGIMGNNEICNMLRKMFGYKYQIVSVYEQTKAADYNFDYLTPFEWSKIFSLFSVTVTKFFHGSMLSLINGTPTIATDCWFKIDDYHDTKIQDLYKRLGLENHYFYMPQVGYNSDQIKERIEYFIENPDTEVILQKIRNESRYYNSFEEALRKTLV